MTKNHLSAKFFNFLEKGNLKIFADESLCVDFQVVGNSKVIDIIDIPIKLTKKPGLIKQLSQAKDLAKNLAHENNTLEIRLSGEPILKLGKDANPKLAKIVTLSNHIEIKDLKKLQKLSKII